MKGFCAIGLSIQCEYCRWNGSDVTKCTLSDKDLTSTGYAIPIPEWCEREDKKS